MALYKVDSDTADLTKVAGGTLYADAPIGTILAYGGITAPSGWLLCQGQLLKTEDYPELYAVIGTNFDRNNTIQMGKFRVPDARECVLVGYSQNNTYSAIANHDTYQLGQFKDDQLQKHGHTFQQEGGNPPSRVPINSKIIFGGSQTGAQYNTNAIQSTSVTDARTGTTTHGKQLGVNYIIKAKHTPVPADFMDAVDDAVETAMTKYDYTIPYAEQNTLEKVVKELVRRIASDSSIPVRSTLNVFLEWQMATIIQVNVAKFNANWVVVNGSSADAMFWGGQVNDEWKWHQS